MDSFCYRAAVSALFVGGADTPGMLAVIVRTLPDHVPNAKLAIIPDAGHGMFHQQPVAFCKAVMPFLERKQ